MLPGFRLIAASFLCGFVAVYAGLRLAASLHSVHVALPIMAAQAAPAPPTGMGHARGTPGAVPVMYDLHFVASATAVAPMLTNLTPLAAERALPAPAPVSEDLAKRPVAVEPPSTDPAVDAPSEEAAPKTAAVAPQAAAVRDSAAVEAPSAPAPDAAAGEPLIPSAPNATVPDPVPATPFN